MIQTSDLRFVMCGFSRLNYPLRTTSYSLVLQISKLSYISMLTTHIDIFNGLPLFCCHYVF
jgi:hypothetical protein